MDETSKLFDDFDHRLKLLDKASKEINTQEDGNNNNVLRQRQQFKKNIDNIQKEFDELSEDTAELVKVVYQLGKILRDKVTTRDLDKIKEKVDSWKLEEFIRHDELEKTFSKYSEK